GSGGVGDVPQFPLGGRRVVHGLTSAIMAEAPEILIEERGAFDVVGIGASAGGVSALLTLIGALPRGFPAAVLVVLHLYPRRKSLLAELLGRRTPLRVNAIDGEPIASGTVYVATADASRRPRTLRLP